MSAQRIVIVGGSVAGGRAAETLRRGGYVGSIVLASAETHRPYDRPPLSKKFLRSQITADRLYLRPIAHYERLGIELALGMRATRLDTSARTVEFARGEKLEWSQLLIATGAHVRRLTCAGADLPGVHTLRTIKDASAIRAEIDRGARRVVIVGAGVIGCEAAASCREEGLEVTLLELGALPLLRAFGEDVGRVYRDIHQEKGVDLRCGVGVAEVIGASRVEGVITTTGERIDCDFVIAGIGVTPSTEWLEGSGIDVAHAVLVDEYARTNIEGVYAAGDVARSWDPLTERRVCVESIDNAQNQGVAAANNMLGKHAAFAQVPFFWSDQYAHKLQSVGHVGQCDRVVVRGSIEARSFIAFHMIEHRIAFAIGVDRMQELGAAKKLIAARIDVPDDVLACPSGDESNLNAWVPQKSA